MCLLIAKKPGQTIPTEHLECGFDQNSDGAGFSYVTRSGKVVVVKGFMKFADFLKAYRSINVRSAHIVHFRWATHGTVNKDNCHPFILPHNIAMGHNGIISGVKSTQEISDTRAFVNDFLTPDIMTNPDVLHRTFYRELVEEFIGGSKLAFINGDNQTIIYNERLGEWHNGVWYSNADFRSYARSIARSQSATNVTNYGYGNYGYNACSTQRYVANQAASGTKDLSIRELREQFSKQHSTPSAEDLETIAEYERELAELREQSGIGSGYDGDDDDDYGHELDAEMAARIERESILDIDAMTDEQWKRTMRQMEQDEREANDQGLSADRAIRRC